MRQRSIFPGMGMGAQLTPILKYPIEGNEMKWPVLQLVKFKPKPAVLTVSWGPSISSTGSSALDFHANSGTDCVTPKCTPYPACTSVSLPVISRPVRLTLWLNSGSRDISVYRLAALVACNGWNRALGSGPTGVWKSPPERKG